MTVPVTTDVGVAVDRLTAGGLVAIPTETVYGLGADAEPEHGGQGRRRGGERQRARHDADHTDAHPHADQRADQRHDGGQHAGQPEHSAAALLAHLAGDETGAIWDVSTASVGA